MDHSGNLSLRQSSASPSERARETLGALSQSPHHRDLAAPLLSRGQMSLLKCDLPQALECFDSASKLDAENPKLFYSQGLSLFEYGSCEGREKGLLLASKKFKVATTLNPHYFEAWSAWGKTLCALGQAFNEHHYFQRARDHLRKALTLSEGAAKDTLSKIHWDLGITLYRIAQHSGEALDLHHALEAFSLAAGLNETLPFAFWLDYGHAALDFALQVNETRFFTKAVSCYKYALSLNSNSSEGWSYFATALHRLYLTTHDEDHFFQANDCFESATTLQPNDAELWLSWAKFLLESTRRKPEEKRLQSCIEKCSRAYAINDKIPLILAIWAESLALLGDLTDRVELIFDAQDKMNDALDEECDDPEILFSYGMCLNACGRYFSDYDYYYQAIEKFQAGLSIDRTLHTHWHALAVNYTLLGHFEGDAPNLVRAVRFFQKALDLHSCSTTIFDQAVALSKLGDLTHDESRYNEAIALFERALHMQRNAIYLHPNWLFHYACTLDSLGDFHDDETYYQRAIEIFSHVLMIDPELHEVHHRLSLALSHLGELTHKAEYFYRAIHHYRLSLKHDEENDSIILDWGVTLINLSQHTSDPAEAEQFYKDAEHKIIAAAKLGNLQAFYHLSCLHSLMDQKEQAMDYLLKADSHHALPPLEDLLNDEWLEGVRSTPDFRNFLMQLEHRPNLQEER